MSTTSVELRVPNELGSEGLAMDFDEDVVFKMGFQREKIETFKIDGAVACLKAIVQRCLAFSPRRHNVPDERRGASVSIRLLCLIHFFLTIALSACK